jgi:hypothetical protein
MNTKTSEFNTLTKGQDRPAGISTAATPAPALPARLPWEAAVGPRAEEALQAETLLAPEAAEFPEPRRLIVLVPDREFDEVRLGAYIHNLALQSRAGILFLTLASSPQMDSFLRRRLATLASLVSDRLIPTSTRLAIRASWDQAVDEVWQAGDLVVCLEDQTAPGFPFRRRPLGAYLAGALSIPVLVLSSFRLGERIEPRSGLREILFWGAALLVIAGFGGLQIFFGRTFEGTAGTVMLSLSVPVELYILSKLTFLW